MADKKTAVAKAKSMLDNALAKKGPTTAASMAPLPALVKDQKPAPKAEDQKPAPKGEDQKSAGEKKAPSQQVANWRAQKAFEPGQKITILVKDKKRGKAKDRFSLYKDGMTVADYQKAQTEAGWTAKLAMADMRWDYVAKFIDVK